MNQRYKRYARIKNRVQEISTKIESNFDTLEELYDKLEQARDYNELILKVRAIFQKLSEEVQQEVAEILCSITTSALYAVFKDDPYECKIRFSVKRNMIEAELYFERDGEEYVPEDDCGGGVVDVASFAARVAFIFLNGSRRVLIADEPFKFVSKDYLPEIPEMLKMLSEKLSMQFIIVSHIREIIDGADNVINLKK